MNEFDQKHNFRDVIGGRACANRFRCFSIYRGNTCGEMCRLPSPRRRRLRLRRRRCFFLSFLFLFPLLPPCFSLFSSVRLCSPLRENYIAKRHAALSRRRGADRSLRISCAIIRENHRGCRHLSIHSHLLSDVH